MSILMILLTSPCGDQFRIAAHCITHCYRDENMVYTRAMRSGMSKRQPEEIDQYSRINHTPHPSMQNVDDYEDDDGTLQTLGVWDEQSSSHHVCQGIRHAG